MFSNFLSNSFEPFTQFIYETVGTEINKLIEVDYIINNIEIVDEYNLLDLEDTDEIQLIKENNTTLDKFIKSNYINRRGIVHKLYETLDQKK